MEIKCVDTSDLEREMRAINEVKLIKDSNARRYGNLYRRRDYWYEGQTVEFEFQPNGFPHNVRVRGELIGFTGGEFFGDGEAYAYVEVEGKYQYRLPAYKLRKISLS